MKGVRKPVVEEQAREELGKSEQGVDERVQRLISLESGAVGPGWEFPNPTQAFTGPPPATGGEQSGGWVSGRPGRSQLQARGGGGGGVTVAQITTYFIYLLTYFIPQTHFLSVTGMPTLGLGLGSTRDKAVTSTLLSGSSQTCGGNGAMV